jgi:hypothetical protein
MNLDEKHPDNHFCPITLEVMVDSVVAADGHSYGHAAPRSSLGSPQRRVAHDQLAPREQDTVPKLALCNAILCLAARMTPG